VKDITGGHTLQKGRRFQAIFSPRWNKKKIGVKTWHILSHIRLTFATLPSKRHQLLLSRLRLVTEYRNNNEIRPTDKTDFEKTDVSRLVPLFIVFKISPMQMYWGRRSP
jgi:hypothetical protein